MVKNNDLNIFVFFCSFLYLLDHLFDHWFVQLFVCSCVCGRVVICSWGRLFVWTCVGEAVCSLFLLWFWSFVPLLACSCGRLFVWSFGRLFVWSCCRVTVWSFCSLGLLVVPLCVRIFNLFISCFLRGSFPRSRLLLRNIPRYKVHLESAAPYRERRQKR